MFVIEKGKGVRLVSLGELTFYVALVGLRLTNP